MAALPSGTVTFLVTDVEGSTRLLDAPGAERYAAVLAEHRAVLREAFAAHGGEAVFEAIGAVGAIGSIWRDRSSSRT